MKRGRRKYPLDVRRAARANKAESDLAETDKPDFPENRIITSANKRRVGTVKYDDFGNAWWKWLPEHPFGSSSIDMTFDQLSELDNSLLSLLGDPDQVAPKRGVGYDPYDAGPGSGKKKSRR